MGCTTPQHLNNTHIMPVTKQPVQWMPRPPQADGVPLGLEYLNGLSSVLLKQRIEMLEVVTGWEVKNRFRLIDPSTGQQLGAFKEDSSTCMRQCCKNMRRFGADVVDSQGAVLFKMQRPFRCNNICCATACDCCRQEMNVSDATGQLMGSMLQDGNCKCEFSITIRDATGMPKYRIANNVCSAVCNWCCNDRHLYIYDCASGQRISTITKKWRGCAVECCTMADALLIEFTPSMTAQDKAVLICGVLLSD